MSTSFVVAIYNVVALLIATFSAVRRRLLYLLENLCGSQAFFTVVGVLVSALILLAQVVF